MMNTVKKTPSVPDLVKKTYQGFSKLNGEHPFKDKVPLGRIEYQARFKKGGRVAFFHYDLAKEMGLIPKNHPNQMNAELEEMILKTFSLVIINEYDIENKIKFSPEDIKPHTYMATRYLQIQHPDKSGRTSGDGRTVWNGCVRQNGKTWDVSSCGTGATRLSPACNINKKFYQTGDPSISYGCGLSEVSEGYETLFFSEVLGKNHLKTEKILAIIEYDKGLSINVRAYENLMRPSHFFGHLKQGNYETLKQVTDYYIERQTMNGVWENVNHKNDSEKYHYFLQKVANIFAKTVADFEDQYIFCWLDWDGDNILMDGGIIDYGSIRQFGLFHSEYRYDDVERFSTTIIEQKQKAKYIVQTFAQIVDFLLTKKKKNINQFTHHKISKYFDETFEQYKYQNLLAKIGFKKTHHEWILKSQMKTLRDFRKAFTFFETAKSDRGPYKVADGITRDAIFCMRDILREVPQLYLTTNKQLTPEEFIEIMKSSYAKKADLKLTPLRLKQIQRFQKSYFSLLKSVGKHFNVLESQMLLDITMRSSIINKYDRVTGDSITHIVNKITKTKPKLKPDELFLLMKEFTLYQNLDPDQKSESLNPEPRQKQIMQGLYSIVRECREGL